MAVTWTLPAEVICAICERLIPAAQVAAAHILRDELVAVVCDLCADHGQGEAT
jgi:hypothetical protein